LSIFLKNNIYGSEFWVNSEELSLLEILDGSAMPENWKRFNLISSAYDRFLIKPVNPYVDNLYPKPEIVSFDKENLSIILRQRTHAEIWVEKRKESLYALDKCWQRQFYPSKNKYEDLNCFSPTFRFYMPWIFDRERDAIVCGVDDSPFSVKKQIVKFKQAREEAPNNFVDFKIKSSGKHMVNDKYGIIDIGSTMYDIHISLTEKEVEAIDEQYRK
jgi:hypothetical protein